MCGGLSGQIENQRDPLHRMLVRVLGADLNKIISYANVSAYESFVEESGSLIPEC